MLKEKKTIKFILKFIFSFSLIVILLTYKTSVTETLYVLKGADPFWLLTSFLLHVLGLFISAFRWQILIKAQGDHARLVFLAKSYLVGAFFNNFLPSRIGGDISRIRDGSRYSQTLLKSSAIILVERLSGIIILLVFASVASIFRISIAQEIPIVWISLLLGLLGLLLIFIFFTPFTDRLIKIIPDKKFLIKIKSKTFDFKNIILQYKDKKIALAKTLFWAFLLQINVIMHFFLIGKALHLQIQFYDYFIFIPIVLLIQLIPITINGLGLREGSYIEIFEFYGVAPGAAFSFALIDVAFMLIIGLAGGIVYVTRK